MNGLFGSKDKQREYARLRQQRINAARTIARHTLGEWQALKEFCGDRCLRCGRLSWLVKDHIIPVYQGGSDGIGNLQPLCYRCNSAKGSDNTDHRPNGWREYVERYS